MTATSMMPVLLFARPHLTDLSIGSPETLPGVRATDRGVVDDGPYSALTLRFAISRPRTAVLPNAVGAQIKPLSYCRTFASTASFLFAIEPCRETLL